MNRKVLVFGVLLLALPLSTIALVQAVPWTERNNAKFQAFEGVGTFSALDMVFAEHQYIPSFEKVNKVVLSWDEPHLTYVMIVGENTYELGTDFLMTECLTLDVFYDPVFADPDKLVPIFPGGYRAEHGHVYWTYDFSAFPGGIEGALRMQLVTLSEEHTFINSLAGTGDLQNVQIKATASVTFTPPMTLNAFHVGIVSGWPE